MLSVDIAHRRSFYHPGYGVQSLVCCSTLTIVQTLRIKTSTVLNSNRMEDFLVMTCLSVGAIQLQDNNNGTKDSLPSFLFPSLAKKRPLERQEEPFIL